MDSKGEESNFTMILRMKCSNNKRRKIMTSGPTKGNRQGVREGNID
jgi:hypothetical protein